MVRTNTGKNLATRLLLASAQDTFSGRTVSGVWGTASDGIDTWTFPVGSTTPSVSGGSGRLSGAASNTIGFLGSHTLTDGEARIRVMATTTASNLMLVLRATSSNTHYRAGLDGVGQINIQRVVAGTVTDLAPTSYTWLASTDYWLHFRVQGSTLALKVWADGTAEPASWTITAFDTAITLPGQYGIRGKPSSQTAITYFDSLVVYQALPFENVSMMGVRLMLSANRNPDFSLRLRTLASTLPAVPMRLVIRLLQNLVYGNVPSRLRLAAVKSLDTLTRTVLFTSHMRDWGERLLLRATAPMETLLRFLLTIPKVAEWANTRARFSLAYAQDTFQNRTVSNAWGNASDGHSGSWTINTTGVIAQVAGGTGQMTGTNASVTAFLGSASLTDGELLVQVTGTNGNANLSAILRATATGTYYRAGLTGTNTISIQKVVAGSATTLVSGSFLWEAGYTYWIRFRVLGTSLLLRVWPTGSAEPSTWNLATIDGTITAAGQFGIRSKTGTVTDTNYFSLLVVLQARPLSLFGEIGSRFLLEALKQNNSLPARILLAALPGRDTASRTRVNAQQQRDFFTRLNLSAGTGTLLKFLPVRFLLQVVKQVDLGVRMSLLPGLALFTPIRFPLIAQALGDVFTRMTLAISSAKLSSGRESASRVHVAFAQDTMVRPNRTGGWGSTADGLTWSFTSTLAQSISSHRGVMTGKGSSNMVAFLGTATLADVDVRVRTTLSNPGSSTTSGDASGVVARATSTGTYYRAGFTTNGSFTITKVVAGTNTDLAVRTAVNPSAATAYWVRLQVIGSTLAARYWQDGTTEPTEWTITAFDTAITDSGQFGLRLKMTTSATATVSYDAFTVVDARPASPLYHLLARIRVSALSPVGTQMRFYLTQTLVSPQRKDLTSRMTVYTAHLQSLVARIRIAAQTQHDIGGRLPVRAMSNQDIGTRLLFAYSTTRLFGGRLRLSAVKQCFSQVRLALCTLVSSGRDGTLRTCVSANDAPSLGARFVLFTPDPPALSSPPAPTVSSAPTSPSRSETVPVALTPLTTYAVNGVPLAQQPISATAPRLDGGAVQAGASFSLLFTNPSNALIAQLPNGMLAQLTFALELGTPMQAPVVLVSLLSPDSSVLTVNCTITTTTVQNTWVVNTQFL